MAIDRHTLDDMLHKWALFRLGEYGDIYWPKLSISGKATEALRTGNFSHGTKHHEISYDLPHDVLQVDRAVTQLPLFQQQVIKVEYEYVTSQIRKAKQLRITINDYRSRLCRARQKLISILS